MDVFSEILKLVKLRGTVYFHAHFQSPWGMDIPAGVFANYHIVTSGSCWLYMRSCKQPVMLSKDDMVLFAKGDAHMLSDSPHSDVVPVNELLNNSRKNSSNETVFGGEGSDVTTLICGHFQYNQEIAHPLFSSLPPLIHISATRQSDINWFTTASELAVQISAGDAGTGKEAIIDRLAETLFIQALASYFDSLEDASSFLAAIQDRNIGLALKSMHSELTHDWTLTELASIASMSRSVFSEKFNKLVGEPPIVYLARWRMLKARELLVTTDFPLNRISDMVGYKSEFAFSKAFKKLTGTTPGAVRVAEKNLSSGVH